MTVGNFPASAQRLCEKLFVATDKTCYLTGERLCVRVDVCMSDNSPSLSKVAYVELADQYQLYAQAMVTLDKGQGWAEIALPSTMHSGTYQLTAYTRDLRNWGDSLFLRTHIAVINGEKISRRDNLHINQISGYGAIYHPSAELLETNRYAAGSEVVVTLPETDAMGCAITVDRAGVRAHINPVLQSTIPSELQPAADSFVPEYEGHIVSAVLADPTRADKVQNVRLSIVGKSASLYDGQMQKDGRTLFYTTELYGNLPVLLADFDYEGCSVGVNLESPYVAKLPGTMPRLEMYCQEEELNGRATQARQMAAVNDWLRIDTLNHSLSFLATEPDHFYDLNEYTSMNSIHEILVEFVRGVRRGKEFGRNVLYTYNAEQNTVSAWPALVLLDGMPVYDIDEILEYDAHLVRYVQIYSGRYSFGNSTCQGVISFITHKGRLSNYKLNSFNKLQSYSFPQMRPVFHNYTGGVYGTLLWEPIVHGSTYMFHAPSEPGQYEVTVQGCDMNGKPYRKYMGFEVRR